MAGGVQRIALVGLAFVAGFGACFIEPALPGNFRFDCVSNGDCQTGEVCADGLCQQPCGGEMDEECDNSNICINGYCSGLCQVSDDRCSRPQVCTLLVPPGEQTDEEIPGVCTVPCDGDHPCGDGQICSEDLGICLTTCMSGADCGEHEDCLGGVCIPRF